MGVQPLQILFTSLLIFHIKVMTPAVFYFDSIYLFHILCCEVAPTSKLWSDYNCSEYFVELALGGLLQNCISDFKFSSNQRSSTSFFQIQPKSLSCLVASIHV